MKYYISNEKYLGINTYLFCFIHDYSIDLDQDNAHAKIVQSKFLEIVSSSIYWSEDSYIQLPTCENWSNISKHKSTYNNMHVFSIKPKEEVIDKLEIFNKTQAKNKIKERMGKNTVDVEIIEPKFIINNSEATIIKPTIISESFFNFYVLHTEGKLIDKISDFFISNGLIREDSLQKDYKLFFNIDFNSQLGVVPTL